MCSNYSNRLKFFLRCLFVYYRCVVSTIRRCLRSVWAVAAVGHGERRCSVKTFIGGLRWSSSVSSRGDPPNESPISFPVIPLYRCTNQSFRYNSRIISSNSEGNYEFHDFRFISVEARRSPWEETSCWRMQKKRKSLWHQRERQRYINYIWLKFFLHCWEKHRMCMTPFWRGDNVRYDHLF